MIGVNLHQVVRGAITALHPDVPATIYRNLGTVAGPGGRMLPVYAEGEAIQAQAQSEGPTTLFHANQVGMEEVGRRFYLNSPVGAKTRYASNIRTLARGGDVFQTGGDWFTGEWWLITALIEDFTRSGWVNVRATLQEIPPDFTASPWWDISLGVK